MTAKKPKVSKRTVEFRLFETSPGELAERADELAETIRITPMADGRGVNFGSPKQFGEHDGEGLPELGNDRGLFDQWKLDLDIRLSYDASGRTYLEIARPGAGTYHRFEFTGISFQDAVRASGRFNNSFQTFLIYYGIYYLFDACYRESSNKRKREEIFDGIIGSLENYFKTILKPKRKRPIGTRELGRGIKLTTFQDVDGRPLKTPDELEREKQNFVSAVFAAFEVLDKGNRRRTQYNVASIIFDGKRNPERKELEKAIGNRLRKFRISWQQIQKDYDGRPLKN